MNDGYATTAESNSAPLAIMLSRALLAGFLASVAMVVAFFVGFVVALVVGTPEDTLLQHERRALRDQAVAALAGSELIVHAGDVGRPEILERLRGIAPLVAVRGNVDRGVWAEALPERILVDAGGVGLYVLHDVKQLAGATGFDVVISGHSHKAREERRDGVLYVNPGSAGPRRFRLPVTVARLDLRVRPWRMELISIEDH